MQWVFGTEAPDGIRKRITILESPRDWSQSLVRSAMEQEASKRRRDSIHKSTSLHQQNALLWTVLPNSLLMCHFVRAERHAEKGGCGWGRKEVA